MVQNSDLQQASGISVPPPPPWEPSSRPPPYFPINHSESLEQSSDNTDTQLSVRREHDLAWEALLIYFFINNNNNNKLP